MTHYQREVVWKPSLETDSAVQCSTVQCLLERIPGSARVHASTDSLKLKRVDRSGAQLEIRSHGAKGRQLLATTAGSIATCKLLAHLRSFAIAIAISTAVAISVAGAGAI